MLDWVSIESLRRNKNVICLTVNSIAIGPNTGLWRILKFSRSFSSKSTVPMISIWRDDECFELNHLFAFACIASNFVSARTATECYLYLKQNEIQIQRLSELRKFYEIRVHTCVKLIPKDGVFIFYVAKYCSFCEFYTRQIIYEFIHVS